MGSSEKKEILQKLQESIDALQGFGKLSDKAPIASFGPFDTAFRGGVFPTGTVHEFLSYQDQDAASTSGFMAALMGKLMKKDGLCLWVGANRKLFPGGLVHFGLAPEQVVFIEVFKQKDILWAIEEGLKCEAVVTVIGEVAELDFTQSQRLLLAVERSGVNGFIHRHQPRHENTVACTTRWKISAMESVDYGLPGLGHTCWNVKLLKVRNGRPGSWQLGWFDSDFIPLEKQILSQPSIERKIG